MSTIKLSVLVSFLLAALAWSADAQIDPTDAVRDAMIAVDQVTEDLERSLEDLSRSTLGESSACGPTTYQALTQSQSDGQSLDRQLLTLDAVLSSASPEQVEMSRVAVSRAGARLGALEDAKLWWDKGPITTAYVDWCRTFISCLAVRHGCTGCFKCYDGLTDCGCFDPCP